MIALSTELNVGDDIGHRDFTSALIVGDDFATTLMQQVSGS